MRALTEKRAQACLLCHEAAELRVYEDRIGLLDCERCGAQLACFVVWDDDGEVEGRSFKLHGQLLPFAAPEEGVEA